MWRSKKGQGLVEMALVLPIILLILLGIIEGGFLFANKLEIQNAAREGARMLSLGADDTAIISNITSGFVLVDSTDAVVKLIKVQSATDPDANDLPDNSVRVKVFYDYTPITGFVYKDGIDLTTSVTMRKE